MADMMDTYNSTSVDRSKSSIFDIIPFKSDASRWNKDWENALQTLCAKDVYSALGDPMKSPSFSKVFKGLAEGLSTQLAGIQDYLAEMWGDIQNNALDIDTPWMLLDEVERKRHLFKGMEDASHDQGPHSQYLRAFCPEITFALLLKQNGNGFLDLVKKHIKGKGDVGGDAPYFLPSTWWDKAVEDMPKPLSYIDASIFNILSLERNMFISHILVNTLLSVLDDLFHGSPGMKPVIEAMGSDGSSAERWQKLLSSMRNKSAARCENCEKSAEELGAGKGGKGFQWMVCSGCKAKLGFAIHYCSQACQKEDWPNHKKYCGKHKISKALRKKINAPNQPASTIPSGGSKNIPLTELGFGNINSSNLSQQTPALQRQFSLLIGDRDADYFLFDELDRPIRFMAPDLPTKMIFRRFRADAFDNINIGAEALGEYLIKMGHKPGLNRATILKQLGREYGEDLERWIAERGYTDGITVLETMSKDFAATFPQIGNTRH